MIVKDTKEWIDECIKKTINTIQMEDIDYNITYNESWYHVTKTNGCMNHIYIQVVVGVEYII